VSGVSDGLEVFAAVPTYCDDDGDAVPLRLHVKGRFVMLDHGNGGRLREAPSNTFAHSTYRPNALTRIDALDGTDAADLDELRPFFILQSA